MEESVITITGLREVQKQLYKYSQQLGDKVVLAALRQGANLVRQEIQQRVPVRTGALRRGFKVSRSRIYSARSSPDTIGIYLTLKKGKTAPFYGRFQNDGYRRGKTQVPGKHFVEKSFAAKRSAAVALIVQSAQAGANLLARKIGV